MQWTTIAIVEELDHLYHPNDDGKGYLPSLLSLSPFFLFSLLAHFIITPSHSCNQAPLGVLLLPRGGQCIKRGEVPYLLFPPPPRISRLLLLLCGRPHSRGGAFPGYYITQTLYSTKAQEDIILFAVLVWTSLNHSCIHSCMNVDPESRYAHTQHKVTTVPFASIL